VTREGVDSDEGVGGDEGDSEEEEVYVNAMHHDAPQGTSQPVPEGQYGGISPPPHYHHTTTPPPHRPATIITIIAATTITEV
jgi:hypothetical protein